MNEPEVLVGIALDASHQHAGEAPWLAAFETRLQARVSRFAADIGLPARLVTRLGLEEQLQSRIGRPLEVRVDGQVCRPDWTQAISPRAAPEEIAELVFDTLYWNRQRVLTRPVMELLRQKSPATPPEDLAALLNHALSHGVSVPDALDSISQWGGAREAGFRPDYALEWILAHRFPRVMTVEAGRRQFDWLQGADEMVVMMRDGLFYETGVKFPHLQAVFGEDLGDDQFRTCVGAFAGPVHLGLGANESLVNDSAERLTLLNVKGKERMNPANGRTHSVVADHDVSVCERAGLTTWDAAGFIILTTSFDLRRQAASFLTMRHIEHVFKRLTEAFPMPIFNALERYRMADIHAVLRMLAEEGISIRNLRDVLETLLEFEGAATVGAVGAAVVCPLQGYVAEERAAPQRGRLVTRLAAHARVGLQWQLSQKDDDARTRVEIGPITEARLSEPGIPLSPDETLRLHAAVAAQLRDGDPGIVLLASGHVRRRLYELISTEFPRVAVLAHEEIAPGQQGRDTIAIDPLAPL